MSRTPQPPGQRGSLKWIQRAVAERWPALEEPVLKALPRARSITWLSPLEDDGFAEYRDRDFLVRLGRPDLTDALQAFWPQRGPQWDALGKTDREDILLVEAKAHVAEMCSPGTAAGVQARELIELRLNELAEKLGAKSSRAAWTEFFYQLANRLAHLDFLRSQGASAYLVLVNFVGDREMGGPNHPEAWEAAYEVAFQVMGLPKRHRLSSFIIHAYPAVQGAGAPEGLASS